MNHWHIRQAVRAIHGGGVIAYPTEAVFGLGCDPLDAQAVMRLLALKGRPAKKGLILIASSLEQLQPYLAPLTPALKRKLGATWPGPVTWLLPVRPETPWWLTGDHDTLAVRVTAHPLAAELCRAAGTPLVSTSANPAGHRPARDALAVQRMFGDGLNYILHGATSGQNRPSEIRDARTGTVVRAG